jgi:hypothetical protein
VGEVAYKLKLPEGAWLHDVFHVGVLKKLYCNPPQHHGQLPPMKNACTCVEPEAAVKSRVARGRRQLLIKWKGQDEATVNWVDADEFRSLYSSFQLADELILQGGRDVMWGNVYSRRGKAGAQGQNAAGAATTDAT